MAITLLHQTKLQFTKRLRDKYRAAEKMEACRLAHKILKHLADGDITTANCLNAWNMTQADWDTKLVKLQARQAKWLAYKAAENAAADEGAD